MYTRPRRLIIGLIVAQWSFCLTAFCAINPADPGLALVRAYGQDKIARNGASALCVECHTENPDKNFSSHYVLNNSYGPLRYTHSGGGWDKGYWGIREGGEFFKLKPWVEAESGGGGSSKYGNTNTWESVAYLGETAPIAQEASRLEKSATEMAKLEMICESCHSIRVNVEGGKHLLAKIVNTEVVNNHIDGPVADICVGCHGFLYHDDQGKANGKSGNWNDARNMSEAKGQRRANNEAHYIGGQRYPRNHHVMTGDVIDNDVVAAGLMVRDVNIFDARLTSIPIRTDERKGTMPVRTAVLPPMVLPKNPLHLNCVTCHAPGHGGDRSMGASLLKGVNLGGRDQGSGMDRISDGADWGRYNDAKFCGMCHE